ncbi:hypothetical protein Mal65_31710 [Crateriforma conspicua]|nr:hypothetical protein Mal65_31710 [Crateriforma conspicua]
MMKNQSYHRFVRPSRREGEEMKAILSSLTSVVAKYVDPRVTSHGNHRQKSQSAFLDLAEVFDFAFDFESDLLSDDFLSAAAPFL